MPLIHLPVQSGSNKILKAMNRKHTIEEYLEILKKLIKAKPDIKFSSDFIIGFPGETNVDFKNTVNLLNQVGFINSYSFMFSPRPGTVAANLKLVKKEISSKRLLIIQKELFENQIKKNKELENKKIDVLVENKLKRGNQFFGRSELMTPVILDGEEKDVGKIVKVKIIKSNQNTLFGEKLKTSNLKVA